MAEAAASGRPLATTSGNKTLHGAAPINPIIPRTSTVLVKLPARPAAIKPGAGLRSRTRPCFHGCQTSHATGPMNRRGRTAINGLVNSTSVGPSGAMAACNMLNPPKIRPMARPTTGPSRTAPMMTGTCIIVSEAPANQGMKPQCVQPKRAAIAPNTPVMVILRMLSFDMRHLFLLNDG